MQKQRQLVAGRIARTLHVESLELRTLLTTLSVVSPADSGPGTLRNAVELANSDASVNAIRFVSGIEMIELDSPVTYSGAQRLTIDGKGATIQPRANTGNLIESTAAADLTLKRLTLQNGLQTGVFVPVPANAAGEVFVTLVDVTLSGNALHGMHVDDQSDPENPDETQANSPASVRVEIWNSRVVGNALAPDVEDVDGIRIEEGGDGEVNVRLFRSVFNENGGDGVEVDERGDGGVMVRVRHSEFVGNGATEAEDGLDIDEGGNGDFWVRIVDSSSNGNADQGFDFDEDGSGDMTVQAFDVDVIANGREGLKADEKVDELGNGDGSFVVTLARVHTSDNGREGIELVEESAGDLHASLRGITANGNAREGIKIEELAGENGDGSGDLTVVLRNVEASRNLNQGVQIYEEGVGNVNTRLHFVQANENGELSEDPESPNDPEDGVRISELGDGDLVAQVRSLTATGNTGYGLVLEQEVVAMDDTGTASLVDIVFAENVLGDLLLDGVVA